MHTPSIILESYNLAAAERLLCTQALAAGGNMVEAAKLLGITHRALKQRLEKHKIPWPAGIPDRDP